MLLFPFLLFHHLIDLIHADGLLQGVLFNLLELVHEVLDVAFGVSGLELINQTLKLFLVSFVLQEVISLLLADVHDLPVL